MQSNTIRYIPIESKTVTQVDKQVQLERLIDQVLIGLVVGLFVVNVVNQAGIALGWW